jgi:hypothetical protein
MSEHVCGWAAGLLSLITCTCSSMPTRAPGTKHAIWLACLPAPHEGRALRPTPHLLRLHAANHYRGVLAPAQRCHHCAGRRRRCTALKGAQDDDVTACLDACSARHVTDDAHAAPCMPHRLFGRKRRAQVKCSPLGGGGCETLLRW